MKIPLTKGLFAIVDDDASWLLQYKWRASLSHRRKKFTARTDIKGKSFYMHRLIMIPDVNLQVDHINGDTLDNRTCNLRIATPAQNSQAGAIKRKGTTSKFRGVYWDKQYRKWRSVYEISGKKHYVGRFDSEIEAAKAWNEATQKAGFLPESMNKILE